MSALKHVVISAAGIGSRLGLNKPKCLVEVCGRSLLDWHLARLKWADTVWLVVGFHEEDVIEHAVAIRKDIIIVRNADYARTNTLQSINLVSRYLHERFLALDADTVIEDDSFRSFLNASELHEQLVGVSPYITSDGVRVTLDEQEGNVVTFTREPHSPMEWTGIAVIKPEIVSDEPVYVYQAIERFLPLPAFQIKAFDIDTVTDLEMARSIVSGGWA